MFDGVFFYKGAEWHIKSYSFKWVYKQALHFIRSHEVDTVLLKRPNGYGICILVYQGAGAVNVISFITGGRVNIGGIYNVSDHNE